MTLILEYRNRLIFKTLIINAVKGGSFITRPKWQICPHLLCIDLPTQIYVRRENDSFVLMLHLFKRVSHYISGKNMKTTKHKLPSNFKTLVETILVLGKTLYYTTQWTNWERHKTLEGILPSELKHDKEHVWKKNTQGMLMPIMLWVYIKSFKKIQTVLIFSKLAPLYTSCLKQGMLLFKKWWNSKYKACT